MPRDTVKLTWSTSESSSWMPTPESGQCSSSEQINGLVSTSRLHTPSSMTGDEGGRDEYPRHTQSLACCSACLRAAHLSLQLPQVGQVPPAPP
eukprot:CAMPEP_0181071476 /NCGR_PEP_ID=MMETSP1070-20121207/28063_1 /TAXON_ID=265543 /ORGANISM="Minutocellus polymorphus, Strain NH13" /LENGTH=92 /DNA_ID=CAMNT_0023152477 /DNA_START=283 /DNA_END=558 /DNA_ORIENTATION=-